MTLQGSCSPAARPLAQRLLVVMDQKDHWAWPALTRPGLSRAQLLVHFQHEYLVYVRDFPALLARAMGQTPPIQGVRAALAENVYEEQTGGISRSGPHPELFLGMMEGLGFSRSEFEENACNLHPSARSYRQMLRDGAASAPWQAAVALLTIFVEGSRNERAELEGTFVRAKGEDAVMKHPLVVHYGCPPDAMKLTRAHGAVEGAHRADAWRIVMENVREDEETLVRTVVQTCERALWAWHRYRDGVAERMGLSIQNSEPILRRAI
ncbi:MAG TPA: iron-containing redox enzyme family protein [Polyangiaceae bacterium]|jgi:pyrroloquinoline-quinone synthase|nr:iron-containing redox enzyme family protein [Polyangiaceae bacterium]